MTDAPRSDFSREDEALRALFAGAPEPADDGFSGRVINRIGARIRRRRLIIGMAVILGALIAAWPLGQLVFQASEGLRALAAQTLGSDFFTQYRDSQYSNNQWGHKNQYIDLYHWQQGKCHESTAQ